MAHLVFAEFSTSFTETKNHSLVYGTSEQIQRDMATRKYNLNLLRQGYCIPDVGTWKLREVRIKREALPEFARDLCAINFNPMNNKISLYKVFAANKGKDEVEKRIPNRQILLVQWIFKWLNRFGLSPLKPCPIADGEPKMFAPNSGWRAIIILGIRDDPTEILEYSEPHEDTL